jgi:ribosomal protein S18 acetylase RimI-like enzyme
MIQVEFITAANAKILDRVDEDVFDFPVQREYVDAFLASPTNLLVVAVDSETVVGMATALMYTHPDKPLQMFINEVGVSCRFHRQGIGRKLVDALLRRARELGCHEAWVATEVSNTAARALFAATGGKEHKEHAVVYFYRFDTPAQDDAGDA